MSTAQEQELINKAANLLGDFSLENILAEYYNIPTRELTEEFIDRQRKINIYPKMTMDWFKNESVYSGYDLTGLRFISDQEYESNEQEVTNFFNSIISDRENFIS